MFRTLHSWQYLYIPYTVFMVALLLYFVRDVHGYMKSCPDSPESPETTEITEMTENFRKVTKYLTKLKDTLINYVLEKSHVIKQ